MGLLAEKKIGSQKKVLIKVDFSESFA